MPKARYFASRGRRRRLRLSWRSISAGCSAGTSGPRYWAKKSRRRSGPAIRTPARPTIVTGWRRLNAWSPARVSPIVRRSSAITTPGSARRIARRMARRSRLRQEISQPINGAREERADRRFLLRPSHPDPRSRIWSGNHLGVALGLLTRDHHRPVNLVAGVFVVGDRNAEAVGIGPQQ